MSWRSWVGGGVLGLWSLACAGLPGPFGPISLERDLEGPAAMAAAALAERVEGGSFPEEIASACDEHAGRLT